MSFGYMGRILDVDLSRGTCTTMPLNDEVKHYIGGKGYCARLVYDMTEPGIDPLGPDNPLVFGTGPYTGTFGLQSCRFAVAAKSPQTGILGNGACGGDFAIAMKRTGYDFIIIRGKADRPVYLDVTEDKAEIKDAAHLWGMKAQEVQKQFPKAARAAVIRPAATGCRGAAAAFACWARYRDG